MRRILSFSICFIIVILNCACTNNNHTVNISIDDIVTDEIIQSATQFNGFVSVASEDILKSNDIIFQVTEDFDNDGNYETFAFDGNATSGGGSYYGDLLCIANGDTSVIYENATYEDIFIFEVGDGTKYLCLRVNTDHNNSLIYGVKEGLPEQTVLSDIGQHFTILSNDEFTLDYSALDGISLSGGHTLKPYYFYYDNGFHEYGATEISVEEFTEYDNSSDYLSYIEEKGGEIQSVLRRSNHLIHINFRCDIPDALQPVWQNFNLTLSEQDGILTPVEENDGTYANAMIPDIAVY